MIICYFGDFNLEYSRNRVLISGFKENGVEVVLCHGQLSGFKKYVQLFKQLRALGNKFNYLIIGYSDSRFNILLAKLLCSKPIIWDAFYSIYDSLVFDRKIIKPYSFKAFYYWILEWLNCRMTDKILLDTDAQIDYFVKTFKADRQKFIRVLVGTDDAVFYPREKANNGAIFRVGFWGKFIPLQGVEYIIQAAKILENEKDILFEIIGRGQEQEKIMALTESFRLKNIIFTDKLPYEKLAERLADFDVCLGIFGVSGKALRVIPNKVYEALASVKPVITADSPAARELFTNGKDILFCQAASAKDLAEKILKLKNNHELMRTIATAGHELFLEQATPKLIVKKLLADSVFIK